MTRRTIKQRRDLRRRKSRKPPVCQDDAESAQILDSGEPSQADQEPREGLQILWIPEQKRPLSTRATAAAILVADQILKPENIHAASPRGLQLARLPWLRNVERDGDTKLMFQLNRLGQIGTAAVLADNPKTPPPKLDFGGLTQWLDRQPRVIHLAIASSTAQRLNRIGGQRIQALARLLDEQFAEHQEADRDALLQMLEQIQGSPTSAK